MIDARSYRASRDQIAAQIESAKANLVSAQNKADRYRKLSDNQAVSKQDIDDAIAAAGTARASLHQYEANLRAANLNLEYTKVLAPISGRIGRSSVTVGALVQARRPRRWPPSPSSTRSMSTSPSRAPSCCNCASACQWQRPASQRHRASQAGGWQRLSLRRYHRVQRSQRG
jgi:multidrug efflux pump subunit AcrA (membrane-fusion protein)